MTLDQCCRRTRASLLAIYHPREAAWIVRIIFEYLKGWSQTDLIMRADEELSDFILSKVDAITSRLLAREPIQYILGEGHFYGMTFRLTSDTLIPRPETEQLVDEIISDTSGVPDLRVLDLCTGSGCIAVALARHMLFPTVDAVDISAAAIRVARSNADALKAHVSFRMADVLTLPAAAVPYDIIVSNPPYIAMSERPSMSPTVVDFEPHSALFVPDDDPLLFYKAIARYATASLVPGGRLYFEINPRFADDLRRCLARSGWSHISLWADARKLTRYLKAIYAP